MASRRQTTGSKQSSIQQDRTRRKRGAFPERTELQAQGVSIEASPVVLSSFLSFGKNARTCVFLCWLWQFKVAEIQGLLKKAKAAANVRQCINAAGSAQLLEDSGVSFS